MCWRRESLNRFASLQVWWLNGWIIFFERFFLVFGVWRLAFGVWCWIHQILRIFNHFHCWNTNIDSPKSPTFWTYWTFLFHSKLARAQGRKEIRNKEMELQLPEIPNLEILPTFWTFCKGWRFSTPTSS